MNAITGTAPGASSGTSNILDTVEEKMGKSRRLSEARIHKAASELGDELEYFVNYGELDQKMATNFYEESRAKNMTEVRNSLMHTVFAGSMFFLDVLYLKSAFPTDAPSDASFIVLTVLAAILLVILGFVIVFSLLDAAVKSSLEWGRKEDCVKLFSDKAAETWGVGSKAIYAVSNDDLQVVHLDAVGTVEMQDDGRLVVSSRFGDSTVTLQEARADRMSTEEVVADLRLRIR